MIETAVQAVRVWDLPTRLFHWLLVVAVAGLLITGNAGGNALVWHVRIGLLAATLLVFRLLWGVVGGRWSRFASFIRPPGTVLRYLRGEHRSGDHFEVGHNPLGSWSVLAMLAVLVAQVATGLIADDEIAATGPLNKFVANATGLAATAWHSHWGQWLIMGLVGLHVVAILAYRLRGSNLITPMVTGDKPLGPDVPPSADGLPQRLLAALLVAACAAAAVWVYRLA